MNIRGAALDRIQQDLVDEADDRRVLDIVTGDAVFVFFLAAGYVEVLEIEIVVVERRHRRVDRFEGLGDALLELGLLDDDRVDPQAGLELDLVDGLQVGRVGNPEEQALAALQQRQHPVLVQQV